VLVAGVSIIAAAPVGAAPTGADRRTSAPMSWFPWRIATCATTGPLGVASEPWSVVYRVRGGTGGPTIRIVAWGPAPAADASSMAPATWTVSWKDSPTGPLASATAVDPAAVAPVQAAQVRVLTPDARCTLVLRAPPVRPGGVAVIGDSLAAGLGASDWPAGWLVTGQAGETWRSLDGEPGSGLLDDLAGMAGTAPRVVAIVAGTNDAILLGILLAADARGVAEDATRSAIADTVARVRASGACAVVVLPATSPVRYLGLGDLYTHEADVVRAAVEDAVGGEHGVVLVDWDALAAGHRLPAGSAGDWFGDDDDIHPNAVGRDALGHAVAAGVRGCLAP
jgi:lysophospholipase L1-like esterase